MYQCERIILPEHEVDLSGLYCYECEELMRPWVGDSNYYVNGIRFSVWNIQGCKCPSCGNIVYSSDEAGLIERSIRIAKEHIYESRLHY